MRTKDGNQNKGKELPVKDKLSKNDSQNPYKGAIILTMAAFFVKILSAVYKVPFQNLTGDAGFYIYQQVYPLYGIAVVFSFSGLPVFISKVLSELDHKDQVHDVTNQIFTGLSLLALLSWAVLFTFSGSLARLMGDADLKMVIQSVSFFLLTIPLIASLRGFFQGRGNMAPTGISQVVEQISRISIILLVAISYGASNWTLYQMGALAMTSSVISGLVAGLVLFLALTKSSTKARQLVRFKMPTKDLISRFMDEGVEIILLASLMVLFQFIDSFTVFNGLRASGMSEGSAMVAKGVYDRAQPFAQLGLTIALAISTSLLPSLTHYFKENLQKLWLGQARSSLRLTFVLASATSIGLVGVMPWLNYALFATPAGYQVLQVYVLSVFFVSVSLASQSILQSTRQKTMIKRAIVLSLCFKAFANYFMVQAMGTIGSSLTTLLATVALAVYMLKSLPKGVRAGAFSNKFIVKLAVANVSMLTVVVALRELLTVANRFQAFLGILGLSVVGVLLYIGLVLKLNLLSHDELSQLPGSTLLKKVGIVKWTLLK